MPQQDDKQVAIGDDTDGEGEKRLVEIVCAQQFTP